MTNGIKSMQCNEVRDQFSSLFEGDLNPPEDEGIREHLRSCESCRKEWEEFNRMMGWLHSVEAEEVPEGFLTEIEKKRKEREGHEKQGGVWSFRSMKIPFQAAAMTLVVLMGLYLTQRVPIITVKKKGVEKPETMQSKISKRDAVKKEMTGSGSIRPEEMEKREAPLLEERRRESEPVVSSIKPPAGKPAREIVLNIYHREMAASEIQELARGLGGNVIREEADVFLVTLPTSFREEFERGLTRLRSLSAPSKSFVQQEKRDEFTGTLRTKEKETEEKAHLSPKGSEEDIVSLRLRLLLE